MSEYEPSQINSGFTIFSANSLLIFLVCYLLLAFIIIVLRYIYLIYNDVDKILSVMENTIYYGLVFFAGMGTPRLFK